MNSRLKPCSIFPTFPAIINFHARFFLPLITPLNEASQSPATGPMEQPTLRNECHTGILGGEPARRGKAQFMIYGALLQTQPNDSHAGRLRSPPPPPARPHPRHLAPSHTSALLLKHKP